MALRSLWNRICRFGCTCPACNARPTAQQQGGGAYRIIKPRPFGTSTLLYTSIFGYATILDGENKSQRREQWEEVLAEKRREVEDAENAVVKRAKSLLESRFGPADAEVQMAWNQAFQSTASIGERSTAHATPNEQETSEPPVSLLKEAERLSLSHPTASNDTLHMEYADQQALSSKSIDLGVVTSPAAWEESLFDESETELEALDLDVAKSDIKKAIELRESLTGERLCRYLEYPPEYNKEAPELPSLSTTPSYSLAPQSLLASKRLQDKTTKRWAAKKGYTIEICMARLVLDLCSVIGLLEQTPLQLEALPLALHPYASLSKAEAEEYARELELELYRLRCYSNHDEEPPPRRNFSIPIPEYSRSFSPASRVLIENLEHLCGKKTSLTKSDVATICSNILESPGRPSVHTINILLVAFTRSQQPALLKPIISLVHDGHIRPSDLTCSTILRHYRHQNDKNSFLVYLSKMEGYRGALMLAGPWLKTRPHFEGTQGRCFLVGEKVMQAVSPSPLIYLEIIMGLLKFADLRTTWEYCQHLEQKGWGFDFTCIYVLMFKSALESALDLCENLWEQAEKLSDQGYKLPRNLYALMIAIYKLENDRIRSWQLFDTCNQLYPKKTADVMTLIRKRVRLIKESRLVEMGDQTSWTKLEREATDFTESHYEEQEQIIKNEREATNFKGSHTLHFSYTSKASGIE